MKTSRLPASESASNHFNQDQQVAAGLSQVDLLTVIGVLVLLGLLLTPALARTRATDNAFQCRNNLRQLIHGWRMHAEDNSDKLPNCFDWVRGALNYNANNYDNTNINYLVNGELGPYVKNPAVYKCPADMSQGTFSTTFGTLTLPRVRSVSMSQAFSAYGTGHIAGTYRHYVKSADMVLPTPSNLWVMSDENPDGVNDAALGVTMDPYGGVWQDVPTPLHNGGCGIAFADGHSDIHKWTDPRTLGIKVNYTTGFRYGIIQPNNRDIMWVQDRTTARK
jgi:prepilin-type processing-associated H-X9-DG protein